MHGYVEVPFKAGARDHFPKAKIIFDKFHVLNVLSVQLDKVRARENKGTMKYSKGQNTCY